jgi:methylamine dehydrogenase accessory protein MauD
VITGQSGTSALSIVSQIGLWIVVILLLVTVFALARQIGLLHRRIPAAGARMTAAGPAIGKQAPEFHGADVFGKRVSLGSPGKKQTLLVFVSPSCAACEDAMAAVRSIQRSERRHLEIVLVALKGSEQENREFANRHPIQGGRYLLSSELGDLYQVTSAPYGVLIAADGTVRSKGILNHLEHLESLLNADEMGQPTMEQFFESRHPNVPDASGPLGPVQASKQLATSRSPGTNGGQRNGS